MANDEKLLSGQQLLPETTLVSVGGHARLHYQGDGNLVVYLDGVPHWASQTAGQPAGSLKMRADGDLVIADQQGNGIAHTRTAGHPRAMVQLQDDGNFVLYEDPNGPLAGTPIWASASNAFVIEHVAPEPALPGPGRLKVAGLAFTRKDKVVLPVHCHFGEAFSAFVRRPADVLRQLDVIKEAGYDGIRFWDVLGYYDSAWSGREVTPVSFRNRSGNVVSATPNYYEHLTSFLLELQRRGLQAHQSRGDLNSMSWNQILAHCTRVGIVQRTVGADMIDLNESCNESWQNGVPELDKLFEMGNAIGSHALRATSAADDGYGGETPEATKSYTWDVGYAHGHRPGTTLDRARHAFSWSHEALFHLVNKPGWQGEWAGPGQGVTVGQENNAEGLCVMSLTATMCSQLMSYMSSHGVFWNGPLEDQVGFYEVPKAVRLLPTDVMTFRALCHGGESQRGKRIFVANPEGTLRCEHRINADGRFAAIIYAGAPSSWNVPIERSFDGVIVTPTTGERHPFSFNAGQTANVSFERGRLVVGQLR